MVTHFLGGNLFAPANYFEGKMVKRTYRGGGIHRSRRAASLVAHLKVEARFKLISSLVGCFLEDFIEDRDRVGQFNGSETQTGGFSHVPFQTSVALGERRVSHKS